MSSPRLKIQNTSPSAEQTGYERVSPDDSGSQAGEQPPWADSYAGLGALSDDGLLAVCRSRGPGTREWAIACELLVQRYAPLVRGCTRPYLSSTEPAEDLMQVGFLGLMKAIRNYDPQFGNGLRAYAVPCITGEIKRHFRDKAWQVRAARPLQELMLELRAVTEALTHELGRLPDDSELAERLGVTPQEISETRRAAEGFSALSLNAPVGGSGDSAELGELLGIEDNEIEQATDMGAVETHWAELPPREQQILLLRFYGNLSQKQVAGRLGISQMHVSRLQARALARLRTRLLGDFDAARSGPPAPLSPWALRTGQFAGLGEVPGDLGQLQVRVLRGL